MPGVTGDKDNNTTVTINLGYKIRCNTQQIEILENGVAISILPKEQLASIVYENNMGTYVRFLSATGNEIGRARVKHLVPSDFAFMQEVVNKIINNEIINEEQLSRGKVKQAPKSCLLVIIIAVIVVGAIMAVTLLNREPPQNEIAIEEALKEAINDPAIKLSHKIENDSIKIYQNIETVDPQYGPVEDYGDIFTNTIFSRLKAKGIVNLGNYSKMYITIECQDNDTKEILTSNYEFSNKSFSKYIKKLLENDPSFEKRPSAHADIYQFGVKGK